MPVFAIQVKKPAAPPGGWVSYFDNTIWNEGWAQGTWTGSQWDAAAAKSGYGLGLFPLTSVLPPVSGGGGWEVGFRPTKVRVTHNASGSANFLEMTDTDYNVVLSVGSYISLTEVDITWGSADDWQLFMGDGSAFSVTNIEFFG
jgi:hypothetical protein